MLFFSALFAVEVCPAATLESMKEFATGYLTSQGLQMNEDSTHPFTSTRDVAVTPAVNSANAAIEKLKECYKGYRVAFLQNRCIQKAVATLRTVELQDASINTNDLEYQLSAIKDPQQLKFMKKLIKMAENEAKKEAKKSTTTTKSVQTKHYYDDGVAEACLLTSWCCMTAGVVLTVSVILTPLGITLIVLGALALLLI